MYKLDELDMKLLYELARDGSISVPGLSKSFNTNSSVLYSRIKRLVDRGLIKKFTIDIDEALLGMGVRAYVGINRDPKLKKQIQNSLLNTDEVASISEVTGRFDILITIVAHNLAELHHIVIDEIGKIDGIYSTETLVELQKTQKDPAYLKPA